MAATQNISIAQLASMMKANLGTLIETKVANNPTGAYSYLKLRQGVNLPFQFDKQQLFGAIAQIVRRGNTQAIANLLSNTNVPYINNPTGGSLAQLTANPSLWTTLNVAQGDWSTLFAMYFLKAKGATA
jgi:hypothetical protein